MICNDCIVLKFIVPKESILTGVQLFQNEECVTIELTLDGNFLCCNPNGACRVSASWNGQNVQVIGYFWHGKIQGSGRFEILFLH